MLMTKAFEIGFGRTEDEVSIDKLPLQGNIPAWITGDLIRNGPGTFRVGEDHYNHWFDGLAMLHRFSFDKGSVSYQNKFLECNAYREAMEKNGIAYSEFATDPSFTIFERFRSIFSSKMTDSAKVSVAKIAEKVLALSETSMQVQFDPGTLKTLGFFNYDSKVNRHVTTVHPHYDRFTDKNYNLTTRFNRVSRYRILEVKESQSPKLVASIPTQEISYLHSFGMSPNYFTLAEFPFRVNPLKILLSGKPFIKNFSWKPKNGTVFHVIDRNAGRVVTKLRADAFFGFHHVNSFEKDGFLYVDIVAYNDAEVIQAFYLDRIREDRKMLPLGELRRYRLDLSRNTIEHEVLGGGMLELPRFDHVRYNMDGSYRYVYGVGINPDKPQSFYNQLVKLDLNENKAKTWFADACYPGEGVFLAEPGKSGEDEGVLLSVVLDEKKGNSFLLVLDASSMKEIGRAEVPHPILFGYHGEHFRSR
jgi:carotenoid cleavage dioxygenase-like enzyme